MYMGMGLADLPNQGRNLRLYTFDPPGTPFYKPAPDGFMYNTGHYDVCAGIACGDPQGFQTSDAMSAYMQAHGEAMAVMVTRNDLPGLCSAVKPAYCAPVSSAPQPQTYVAPNLTQPANTADTGGVSLVIKAPAAGTSTAPTISSGFAPSPSASLDQSAPSAVVNVPPVDNTALYVGIGLVALLVLTRKGG